jgi:hypothetical protein
VYRLPWLSHCPIHHCALTPDCPVCTRPWPVGIELARRDCTGCGPVPLERLGNLLAVEDTRVIGELFDFSTRTDPPHSLVGGSARLPVELLAPWWQEITTESPLFASAQAHRKPSLTETELTERHIVRPAIQHRSTALIVGATGAPFSGDGSFDPFDLELTRRTRRYRRRHFRAWQSIVSWIADQTAGHRLHITNYRNRRPADFLSGPDPCPYCMALSLWFFHTAAQRYGPYYARRIDVYPFYQHGERGGFFDTFEPLVRMADGTLLLPEQAFSDWFVQQELVLLYRYVLETISEWCEQLIQYRDSREMSVFRRLSSDPFRSACWYTTALGNNELTFYYEHEQPLDAFDGPRFPRIKSRCRAYHRHAASNDRPVAVPFDHVLDPADPGYSEYLDLHDRFHAFLLESFDPPGIRRVQ